MMRFGSTWPDPSILQQPVAKLHWRSIILLLTRIKDNKTREWYAQKAIKDGWSSTVLDHMIDLRLIEREAVTKFDTALLPPSDVS